MSILRKMAVPLLAFAIVFMVARALPFGTTSANAFGLVPVTISHSGHDPTTMVSITTNDVTQTVIAATSATSKTATGNLTSLAGFTVPGPSFGLTTAATAAFISLAAMAAFISLAAMALLVSFESKRQADANVTYARLYGLSYLWASVLDHCRRLFVFATSSLATIAVVFVVATYDTLTRSTRSILDGMFTSANVFGTKLHTSRLVSYLALVLALVFAIISIVTVTALSTVLGVLLLVSTVGTIIVFNTTTRGRFASSTNSPA